MNEYFPRIRIMAQSGVNLVRDSLSLNFFIRQPHREIARRVLHCLEMYVQEIGPQALGGYADEEGEVRDLNSTGWTHVRNEILESEWPMITLCDESARENRYGFEYFGKPLGMGAPQLEGEPHAACTVSFWLPTEYLKDHGPERLREFALRLVEPFPFCFGQAGLAFNAATSLLGVMREVRKRCFRYPGMDLAEPCRLSWHLGTRVRGPSWMTFLGQPVLGELGGAAGLRSRLSSPGTTVHEMTGERAVVTLGEWPDAGDIEQGRTLPAYRELARVLEPWLYHEQGNDPDFPPEDMRRWERRFLD